MRAWAFMVGGLVIWSAHFVSVYGMASLAAVGGHPNAPMARLAVGGVTLACAAADCFLILAARRRARRSLEALDRFVASLGGLAAGVSLISVLWQGLPGLVDS